MVRSINEPATPALPSGLDSPNEPAPVAVVTEDGVTVFNGEITPPTSDVVDVVDDGVKANEPAPDAVVEEPVNVKPVSQGALADFISNGGKPN